MNDRLVVGVEYDVLHHDIDNLEGEDGDEAQGQSQGARLHPISTNRRESVNLDFGGWVWDLPPAPGSGANRDDDLWLAYGDYDVPKVGVREEKEMQRKKKEREKKEKDKEKKERTKDWEEATRWENKGRTGEWRRRRWVRLVKRKVVE